MIDYKKSIEEKFNQYDECVSSPMEGKTELEYSQLKTYGCTTKLLDTTSPFCHAETQSVSDMFSLFSSTSSTTLSSKEVALKSSDKLREKCFKPSLLLHQKSDTALNVSHELIQQITAPRIDNEVIKNSLENLTGHANYLEQLQLKTNQFKTSSVNSPVENTNVDTINQMLRENKAKASILGVDQNSLPERDAEPVREKLQKVIESNQKSRHALEDQSLYGQLDNIHNNLQQLQDTSSRALLSDPSLLAPSITSEQLNKVSPDCQNKYIVPLQSCDERLQEIRQKIENYNLANCYQSPSLLPSVVSSHVGVINSNLNNVSEHQSMLEDGMKSKLNLAQERFQQVSQAQADYTSNLRNSFDSDLGDRDQLTSISNYQAQLSSIKDNLPEPTTMPHTSSAIEKMRDGINGEMQDNNNFLNNNSVTSLNNKLNEMSQTTDTLIPVPELDNVKNEIKKLGSLLPDKNTSGSTEGKEMVVSLATITCSYGVAISSIEALPKSATINGRPILTTMEYAPFVNVLPFPNCISPNHPLAKAGLPPPYPCAPLIASPWQKGSKKTKINGVPVVTNGCSCDCTFAEGEISFIQSGQLICKTD